MNILFLMCIIEMGASQFPLDGQIAVTVGVMDQYRSTCIYLFGSTHVQGEYATELEICCCS
jgi:hypothetical protein